MNLDLREVAQALCEALGLTSCLIPQETLTLAEPEARDRRQRPTVG